MGWIKLHRKTIESRVFANEGLLKVWVWCLLKANHSKQWVDIVTGKGKTEVEVLPGQFIFGRKTAGKELKMKPETVRSRMEKLKKTENITMQSTSHFSIVSIVNWGTYQEKDNDDHQGFHQPDTNHSPTRHQPFTTDKKEKKEKKEKNIFKKPTIEEIKAYCQERKNNIDPEAFYHFYGSKDWKIGTNKMKSWKSAMITWEKNNKKTQEPTMYAKF